MDNLPVPPLLQPQSVQPEAEAPGKKAFPKSLVLIAAGFVLSLGLVAAGYFLFNKSPLSKLDNNPKPTQSSAITLSSSAPQQSVTLLDKSNLEITKYDQDSDKDSIPDFVELAIAYDPMNDECLVAACDGTGDLQKNSEKINILFILDASGSMAEKAGSEVKMIAAKNSLANLINSLSPNVNVGLMVYGHKGSNATKDKMLSCQSIDLIYPIKQIQKDIFMQSINSFNPTGWTPIGGSLQKAESAFLGMDNQKNIIILITDGIETCETDPVAAIKALQSQNIKPIVNIIGLAVSQSDSAILKQLADLGGGEYVYVSDTDKLEEEFINIKKALETLQCNQNSTQSYISCVVKRADNAVGYLTKLNQSIYLENQEYLGVKADTDDTHEAIKAVQTAISNYRNQAGTIFAELLKKNSAFFGSYYQDLAQ